MQSIPLMLQEREVLACAPTGGYLDFPTTNMRLNNFVIFIQNVMLKSLDIPTILYWGLFCFLLLFWLISDMHTWNKLVHNLQSPVCLAE